MELNKKEKLICGIAIVYNTPNLYFPRIASMFEGFSKKKISVSDTKINLVTAGNGPPLLLLHGYPQNHEMWHKVAPSLTKMFTLVITDLRGYGDSGIPEPDKDHYNYSKRATAKDQIEVMDFLGYPEFMVCGHDRGGRVAQRMTLDYPDKVLKICVGVFQILLVYMN